MIQRWKLTIEYDGHGFVGWQSQDNGVSVQQTLEHAVFRLSGQQVRLHVAGRTDSGVHALGQVAHFDLEDKDYTEHEMRNALNVYVRPHHVSVVKAEKVSEEFHARFGAQKRYYRYVIINRPSPPSIGHQYAWHIHKPLDIEAMRQAITHLLGTHDFSSFRASECQAKSPIRTLDKIEIIPDGEKIYFDVEARSFLHHQVRNIMGTLKRVGDGSWHPDKMLEILAAKSRAAAGPTAPAKGLFFIKVDYDDNFSK